MYEYIHKYNIYIYIYPYICIHQVTSKGMGAELLDHTRRLREIVTVASRSTSLPMTVKIRVGHYEDEERRNAHKLIPELAAWGASGRNFEKATHD